ncbi:MAG TPA: alpha-L-rhamnosidase N-terminal domain-containing protein, partial [Roseiflexaceae bacterium]
MLFIGMDLSPASWIWFPSRRTLPNTFVLFRRTIELDRAPSRAAGWITADSRYRLTVNGTRVQWGPAPCDPRELDVDPVDLAPHLRAGTNVIGVEVLFYGLGEGTWVAGKPGLLCHFELEDTRGRLTQIVSDETWQTFLDRAHRPGQYKRWFLRALQEEFDARLHPHGWDTPAFVPGAGWLPAMRLDAPADKPSACGRYFEYLGGDSIPAASAALRERGIPPLREIEVPALRLADAGRVTWWRDPLDWFEYRTPDSFQITREPIVVERGAGRWELLIPPINVGTFERSNVPTFNAAYVTFQLAEQVVGWPFFTIDAPAGTIVELICQESHDPARTAWLDSHFYAWSRFVCREGVNRFETFDFESLRWMQLHVRLPDDRRPTTDDRRPTTDNVVSAPVVGGRRSVVISGVGVRRRMFPWPHQPRIGCDDPALQRLFDAAVNTLHNSAQETCVDGMGRERQQYSGDGGHQLQAIRYTFGETRLPRRFLATFGAGLTADGYFLDCWPAY